MHCINVCVKMFYHSPNMWNQLKIEWKKQAKQLRRKKLRQF